MLLCWVLFVLLLGHLHLKVRSASIVTFWILLTISPCFVWISARIFHFSVSHKSLSFITWNLIEYLHTQDFQRATVHLNVWTNILFCFVYGCKQNKNILTESKRRKLVLTLRSPLHFKLKWINTFNTSFFSTFSFYIESISKYIKCNFFFYGNGMHSSLFFLHETNNCLSFFKYFEC